MHDQTRAVLHQRMVDAARDNVFFAGILFFVFLLPVVDFYRDKIRIHFDLSRPNARAARVVADAVIKAQLTPSLRDR